MVSLSFLAPRPTGEILRVALAGRGPLRLAVTSRSLGLPPGAALPPTRHDGARSRLQ
ncbi:MAG: hypothetical protein WKG07_33155 [Hymenobacter sp.]